MVEEPLGDECRKLAVKFRVRGFWSAGRVSRSKSFVVLRRRTLASDAAPTAAAESSQSVTSLSGTLVPFVFLRYFTITVSRLFFTEQKSHVLVSVRPHAGLAEAYWPRTRAYQGPARRTGSRITSKRITRKSLTGLQASSERSNWSKLCGPLAEATSFLRAAVAACAWNLLDSHWA
jgi:hypothetical protein